MKHSIASLLILAAASFSHVHAALCFPFSNDNFCVYATDQGSSVKFRYDAPSSAGWVAFGPGESMKQGDIVVAWPNADKSVTVSRRSVAGFRPPTYAANQVTLVANETGVKTINGKERMIATFIRSKSQLSTAASSLAITTSASSFIWAGNTDTNPGSPDPSAEITKHGASTKRSVPNVLLLDKANEFVEGSGSNGDNSTPGKSPNGNTGSSTDNLSMQFTTSPYIIAHGLLLVISWGFLAPIAIIIARFFKNNLGVWWFRLHWGLFALITTLTIIAFALIVAYTEQSGKTHFNTSDPLIGSHSIIGVIFVCLVPIQVIIGIVIDRLFDPKRTSIPVLDKVHWWLGRILWCTSSLILIPLGIALFGASIDETLGTPLLIAYFVYLVLVLGGFIALQVIKGQTHHEEKKVYDSVPTAGKDGYAPTLE